MEMRISIITNETPGFYSLLGPFLANPTVAHVYGDHLWEKPGDVWAVAQTPQGQVMGFATLRPQSRGHELLICNDYVEKQFLDEGRSVQTQLLTTLLTYYPGTPSVMVVAAPEETEYYQEHNFVQVGKRGSFPLMKRTVEGEK